MLDENGIEIPEAPETEVIVDRKDSWLDKEAPHVQTEVKSLRSEAKDYRLKLAEAKKERDALKQEADALKTEKKEAETKRMEDALEYKALWEKTNAERSVEVQAARAKTIEAEIRASAIEKGLPPKLVLKLVERNGIAVDSDGNVTGIDLAMDRMLLENEEIIKPIIDAAKATAKETVKIEDEKPKSITSIMKVPGTDMTYDELRAMQLAATGQNPKRSESKAPVIDHRKMTKAESNAAYEEQKRKMGGGKR